MRIIVSDSSSLIDLKKGGILEAFLGLPFEIVVPSSMLSDELLSFSKAEISLMRRRMTVAMLDGRQMARVFSTQRTSPALTVYDCMAFVLAEETSASILLTGDRRMRLLAEAARVECHGVLWVVEQLAERGISPTKLLLKALTTWRTDELVRLPRNELERLISRLKSH